MSAAVARDANARAVAKTDPWLDVAIHGYTPHALVHAGPLARVYRGTGPAAEPVAIKVYKGDGDGENQLRFEREATIGKAVAHTNVARHIAAFVAPNRDAYVVSEWVEGHTLNRWRERATGAELLDVFSQLARGLSAVHAAGVVHRDIKPSNVMIATEYAKPIRALLMDFNHAFVIDAVRRTAEGRIAGTAKYIAPEVMDGEPATVRSDLYSFGVVLAETLTVVADVPEVVRQPLNDVSAWLLEPEPMRRVPSAQVLGATLHAIRLGA